MWELIQRFKRADRNLVAVLLSVVPGAGHLYKHHYLAGLGILVGGNLTVAYVAVLLGLATFGVSLLLLPLLYLIVVAGSAYAIPDWHGHHPYLHPWTQHEMSPDGKWYRWRRGFAVIANGFFIRVRQMFERLNFR